MVLRQRIDQDQHWFVRWALLCAGVGVGHAGRVLEGGEQCGEHGLLLDHVMFKTVDQSSQFRQSAGGGVGVLEQFGEGTDVGMLCAKLRERCCYPVGVQAIRCV